MLHDDDVWLPTRVRLYAADGRLMYAGMATTFAPVVPRGPDALAPGDYFVRLDQGYRFRWHAFTMDTPW